MEDEKKQPIVQGQQVPLQQAIAQQPVQQQPIQQPLQQTVQQPVAQQPLQQAVQQPAQQIVQQPTQQQPLEQELGQTPSTPVPSTTPELEQVLIKIQELEQRLGDLEIQDANDIAGQNEGKFEKLKKEQVTGLPEVEKDKKPNKDISPKATDDVPKAQTSEVDYEAGGKKDGAPVSGEETGLDKGEPSEKDAIAKVPKPAEELPKQPIIKNALEGADGGVPSPGKPSEKPNKMEDEEGNKMPKNISDGFEEHYNSIKSKLLSGRKSVVGATGNVGKESFINAKDDANSVIKEYLQKSNIRIN